MISRGCIKLSYQGIKHNLNEHFIRVNKKITWKLIILLSEIISILNPENYNRITQLPSFTYSKNIKLYYPS